MITSIQALDLANVDPDESVIIVSFEKNTHAHQISSEIARLKQCFPDHKICGIRSTTAPLIQIITDKVAANKIAGDVNAFTFDDKHDAADPIDREFMRSLENKDDLNPFNRTELNPIPVIGPGACNPPTNWRGRATVDQEIEQMNEDSIDRERLTNIIRKKLREEKMLRVNKQLKELGETYRFFANWDEGTGE